MNRLKLDFSLQYNDERSAFLQEYLTQPQFAQKPPTQDELETMGNYVLWGKDRKTGLNAKQDKSVPLSSRSGDWDTNTNVESLDALIESPTFNETQLSPLDATTYKTSRVVFSRTEALAQCPEFLRETFRSLFRAIDELDLRINYYEVQHGRRLSGPRQALLNKFEEEEINKAQEAVTHWNQFMYLKQRHQLVELRRQQYTLRDSYRYEICPPLLPCAQLPVDPPTFDNEISVAPLGTIDGSEFARLVFRPFGEIFTKNYTQEQLGRISRDYWAKKNNNARTAWVLDFEQLEHVYEVFSNYYDLEGTKNVEQLDNRTTFMLKALEYYTEMADLSDLQKDILRQKMNKQKNTDIARDINERYHKSYTPNYISTIFRQRIIPKINDAATYHRKLIENVFFVDAFKTCTGCGRTLLKDEVNFTHKARSTDGFTTRCKQCEKQARLKGGIVKYETVK